MKIKEIIYHIGINILGISASLLFIYSGVFLMSHYMNNDMIFGMGLLLNMFGGYGFFKMVFEYGKKTN